MQNNDLPVGCISVDEAIKLINSDTRTDAKVDTEFLLRNLPYLRPDGTYTIKKLRTENGRLIEDGNTTAIVRTEYEKTILEHAIVEHYKKMTTRQDFDPDTIGLRSITTTVDEETNIGAHLMRNKKPLIKPGEDLGSGSKNIEE